jgi:hypothetical protein
MSISSKKLVSAALTATTLLWMVGASVLPVANAQSTADLQAQIAALLAQIQQLQGQLSGGSGSMSGSVSFTRDLTVGSKGADVSSLQQILINKGFLAISAPTGYFGPATKAALAKWQASAGISPAVGYFGPKSRAFLSSTGTGNTGGGNTGGGTTPAPASGLRVSTASDNPAAGSLITAVGGGAARVPVMAVNFTAGNSGAVTVTEIKVHKTGVLSDNAISGAYLTRNGQVIAQYNSINQGVIDFSGLNWQISAGQTGELMLAIDVAGGLSAGNTVGFSIASASDVTAWDSNNTALMSNGNFPLMSNTFTVTSVTNPSLASLVIAGTSIGTQVTAGTQGNLVGAWNFNVGNSRIWLKGLNFRVIGSANKGDIRNVKLMVNGAQVGNTLASVAQDGTAFFDASANPGVLNTGSNNVQLFADVVGSPSFNFQFEILNGYDVYAVDSQYNVPVSTNSQTGTQVSIQQGQITVTQDSATPTGNIAKGQSQIPLAKFDIYAAGEGVRVKFLSFQLVFAGLSSTIANTVKNLSLVDDAGGQVGSSINTPPTGNTCDVAGSNVTSGLSGSTYTDCFGTASSPINYVIPANTTRVLTLKADIQSTALFSNVTAQLTGNVSNLQGVTSSQTGSTGGATGSALSLANSSLSVSANNALGTQNVSAGSSNLKIGSYSFTASSAEGVNVNNLSVRVSNATTTNVFQNLKVKVNGAQFGTTQGIVNAQTVYTFSGNPFNVPAGTTVNVDVFADTLSTANGTISPATELTGCAATGQTTFTAVNCSGTITGQNLTFAGNSTVTVTADSSQPAAGQIVMGSTGNTLAVLRFTETSNVENVKITDLNVIDSISGTTSTNKAAFSNLQLFNGATLLGTAGSAVASQSSTAWIYTFHLATPIVVPQANSISVTLKGDAASFASSGSTDNTTHTFKVATTTDATNLTAALAVVALGNTSNKASTASISAANGNTMTVLRTTLTAAGTALGGSAHSKANPDDVGTVTFTANAAGPAALNSVKVTFTGAIATSAIFTTASNFSLIDANGNNVVGSDNATVATSTVTGGFTATWTFGTGSAGFQISAGSSYTFKVRLNTTAVAATANVSQSLSATVQAAGDVTYTDGLDSNATSSLTLTTAATPFTINSITYPNGQ